MPEIGKEQDPDVTAEEEPDADEPKELTDNPSTITADDVPNTDGEDPAADANPIGGPIKERKLIIPPEVEDAFRRIVREEIGKALGHTIV